MKIRDIPWYNRPGARLKKKGVSNLSDAELLAIILGRGNKEENAIDLSNRTKILENAGDLLGINVLDHIIIGKDNYYSFKENE